MYLILILILIREGPRKALGSDKWLPRKLIGKVTNVTEVADVARKVLGGPWSILGGPRSS